MNQVKNRIEKKTYQRYVVSFCLILAVAAVIVGKLVGGVSAVAVAAVLMRRKYGSGTDQTAHS